ncbi:Exocyst complex component 4 [Eumeta japonica]|uniref:Exocyst complex component Sec8 n=1 Tax=Eumeta variegata TaxID=151549 RepID=A0A4C1XFD5_EUMVA|nr:Exocyst complex component 4 [Eumeta japonica]
MRDVNEVRGNECTLRAFVSDYVRHGEAERLAARARAAVDAAVRGPAAWREAAPPPTPTHTAHRIIYSCCWTAWIGVERAAGGVRAAGVCGGADAARALLDALGAFAAAARAAHHQLTPQPRARAARWLADDDIARFLQALPNWRVATAPTPIPAASAADLRHAYEREADILGSSLGDGAIASHEIVATAHTLRDLALMCESMDWVASRVRDMATRFGRASGAGLAFRLPDKLLDDIESTALIFEEISHKCLLLLHLELRVRNCFYYLGQEEGAATAGAEDNGGMEEGGTGDAAAVGEALARALLTFHELAAPVLAPHRLAYVMEGLAEMMSAGVIWRCVSGGGGTGASTARLAALRHCLAALGVSSQGLHRAAHYLQLLECSPEEVIGGVEERGAQFSELEYLHALRVTAARRHLGDLEIRAAQRRLAAALGHTGVTV